MSKTKTPKSKTTSWTIKGVENDTRQKVTKAAKRAGMTIGAYVDRVLLESATADLKGSQLPARVEDVQDQLNGIQEAIAKLSEKVEQPKRRSWNIFGKK